MTSVPPPGGRGTAGRHQWLFFSILSDGMIIWEQNHWNWPETQVIYSLFRVTAPGQMCRCIKIFVPKCKYLVCLIGELQRIVCVQFSSVCFDKCFHGILFQSELQMRLKDPFSLKAAEMTKRTNKPRKPRDEESSDEVSGTLIWIRNRGDHPDKLLKVGLFPNRINPSTPIPKYKIVLV